MKYLYIVNLTYMNCFMVYFFVSTYFFSFLNTVAKRELAFVCEEHYPNSQAPWRPPHACSFALCSQCIRNEVGMSMKMSLLIRMKIIMIELM